MATEDQLLAEASERPRIAVAAAIAALLTLASPVIGLVALAKSPTNLPASAIFRSHHELGLGLSAACSALGLIAIVFVLDYLYRATRLRNDQLPPLLRPVPWIGGIGLAAVTVAIQIATTVRLSHFATHGSQTYKEAQTALDFGALAYAGLLMQLAFSLAIVMISLNAMRAGLITRFLGYLGIISAALFVLPLVPVPIVQIYWLGALAALLAGRMAAGLPPAWSSGRAEPWPSSQELREARVRAAEARRGGNAATEQERFEAPVPGGGEAGSSPATSRRKRKKRR